MNARSRSLSWELGRRRRRQSGEGGGGEDDIEGTHTLLRFITSVKVEIIRITSLDVRNYTGGDKASEEQDMDAAHQGLKILGA